MDKPYCMTLKQYASRLVGHVDINAFGDQMISHGYIQSEDQSVISRVQDENSKMAILLEILCGNDKAAYDEVLRFLEVSDRTRGIAVEMRTATQFNIRYVENASNPATWNFAYHKLSDYPLPSQVNIVLLGKTGSGKSHTGNTLLGSNFFKVVPGTESGTKTVNLRSKKIDDFNFIVMDTPGLFDTEGPLSDADAGTAIMDMITSFPDGVHVFLLVCRSDVRFTAEEQKTFERIQELLGESLFRHSVLIITHFKTVLESGKSISAFMQSNDDFRDLYRKVGKRAIGIENEGKWTDISDVDQQQLLRRAACEVIMDEGGSPYSDELFEKAKAEQNKMAKTYGNMQLLKGLIHSWMIDVVFKKPQDQLDAVVRESMLTEPDFEELKSHLDLEKFENIDGNDIKKMVRDYIAGNRDILMSLIHRSYDLKTAVVNANQQDELRKCIDQFLKQDCSSPIKQYLQQMTWRERDEFMGRIDDHEGSELEGIVDRQLPEKYKTGNYKILLRISTAEFVMLEMKAHQAMRCWSEFFGIFTATGVSAMGSALASGGAVMALGASEAAVGTLPTGAYLASAAALGVLAAGAAVGAAVGVGISAFLLVRAIRKRKKMKTNESTHTY